MFNRRTGDDLAAVREIVREAARGARSPGPAPSRGNASGAYGTISTPILPVPDQDTAPLVAGERSGESGVDASGNEFYPFILGIDTFENESAYWVRGFPTIDYTR